MKLLLLTDIPPCSNLTAGLVLAQMCRWVPQGSLACFTVLNRHLAPEPYPDLAWIPTATVTKPNELSVRKFKNPRLSEAGAAAIEAYKGAKLTPRLVEQAARFARQQQVDAVWAVLQGQTMVRMARPLAKRLRVPLLTQVWDPLSWWLRGHNVDRWTGPRMLRAFDETMRASRACATASWAMADEYHARYGVRGVPVLSSHDASLARTPPPRLHNDGEVVIGMAGQFYANNEWLQLVSALHSAGFQVSGRKVKLLVVGHNAPAGLLPPENVEFLGWQEQSEALRILSERADILYCPYPFDPAMEEVARLSFPTKAILYLATGRPMLLHGPPYASPVRYFEENGGAAICRKIYTTALYNELQRLVDDRQHFAATAKAGQAAFMKDFTLARQRQAFYEFVGQDLGA